MLGYSSSFFIERRRSQETAWWMIAFAVLMLHLVGLWFGASWSTASVKKEAARRVVVTTVALSPKLQSIPQTALPEIAEVIKDLPIQAPLSLPKEEELPAKAKAEAAPPLASIPPKEEEPLSPAPMPEPAPMPAPEPAPIPAPTAKVEPEVVKEPPAPPPQLEKPAEKKTEAKPEIKQPAKPVVKAAAPAAKKSTPAKKPAAPAPVKKQADPAVKKTVEKKAEPAKNPAAEEAEKKRQKELAAKKEAEKQRQKEIAAAKEAEKLRQKEIAAVQEAARKRQQELLAKAKENLAKMGETRDKISTAPAVILEGTAVPRQIENLQIDALPVGSVTPAELNAKEIGYRDEVAHRLKLALRLPDYGSVKIKLTLDKTGKVAQIAIVKSESQKNKQYVEKTVPTLLFPAFGNQFDGASQYTFVVTLNNDY